MKIDEILKIDMNKINKNDIYGHLMSYIKYPCLLQQEDEEKMSTKINDKVDMIYTKNRI